MIKTRLLPRLGWFLMLLLLALPVWSGCRMLPVGGGSSASVDPSGEVSILEEEGVESPRLTGTRIQPPLLAARAPYRLREGDPVIIYLRGIMPKDEQIEEIVDERGYVTLPYIDDVMAAERTSSELEREIQRIYIERQIYRTVSVNVVMPSQSYFVQGEVRQPQRYPLLTGVTLLQAIATAGGYTEFADPKRVTLTRGRDVRVVNMRDVERNPQQDINVESGDVIRVPRSIF